jgi:hypothetical protein
MEKNGEKFWGRPGPTKGCRASDDDDDDESGVKKNMKKIYYISK